MFVVMRGALLLGVGGRKSLPERLPGSSPRATKHVVVTDDLAHHSQE
jgi:hypothetical protein